MQGKTDTNVLWIHYFLRNLFCHKLPRMLQRFVVCLLLIPSCYAQDSVSILLDSLTMVSSEKDKSRISQKIAWELKDTDWDRALTYLEYAEKEALASPSSKENLAKFYVTAAHIYDSKDVLDIALEYYQKAYNIYDQTNDVLNTFKLENDLAIIYAKSNNRGKAHFYFQKVYDYQVKQKDSVYLARILNNLGTLYFESKVIDSSYLFYQKALDIAEKLDDRTLKMYIYTNLGKIYHTKNEPRQAQKYFNKSNVLINNDVTDDIKGYVYQSLSEYYFALQQNDSVIHYANKVTDLLENSKYSFANLNTMKTLYKAHLNEGNFKEASTYFELYDSIRDSINIEEKAVNVERLKLAQEYKIKDQKRGFEEDRKKFRYFLIGLTLIIALLILSILLIKYRNRLSKSRLERKLVEEKQKDLKASLELKNKVLVTKAMAEIHRTEIIEGILQDLKHIKRKALKKETQQAIDYIVKRLGKNTSTNLWNEFETSFEQVHESFYKNINNQHPYLTAKDRRLCALLILDLTSKEISQVTGQSYKSVENARTRLRRKLNLTNTKTDLITYLHQLQ